MSFTLVAKFDISLDVPLLFMRADDDPLLYELQLDGYDVSLHFITNCVPFRLKAAKNKYWSEERYIAVEICVSKEDIEPPPINKHPDGTRSYETQRPYFEERLPLYRAVARRTLNALIQYFKYRLWQPMLDELPYHVDSLNNPEWTDCDGVEVGKGTGLLTAEGTPGIRGELGTVLFQTKHDKALTRALLSPIEPRLEEELLYDAQVSIIRENVRRAVLEMALTVEVMVKRKFFGGDVAVGAAFEHLEDRGNVNVRVVDLLHLTAKAVYGDSFKDTNPDEYKHLDHLFRARNKVAHRGKAVFRDDSGVLHEVDDAMLRLWWDAVTKLRSWLRVKRYEP